MEVISSTDPGRGLEVQTENSCHHDFPILCFTYITGRTIMISITMYFFIMNELDALEYHYYWLGFLTIHMILECSVTYSDPIRKSDCTKPITIHIHWIFAVASLIFGTVYFYLGNVTPPNVSTSNSTSIATSANDIEPKGSWHCAYSYWMLSLFQSVSFLAIFITGVVLFAGVRVRRVYLYRFHKYGGTLVTYSTIILLACNVFSLLMAPTSWVIFLLSTIAFVLMPVRIFSNRSAIHQ